MQFFYSTSVIVQVLNNQGSHYFSKAARKGFGSRLLGRVYGGRVFVESVKSPSDDRWYSVKCVEWSPKHGYAIETIGQLMTTTEPEVAKRAAKKLGDLCNAGQVPDYFEYGDSDRFAQLIGFTNETHSTR
jgi:hypothetical protein